MKCFGNKVELVGRRRGVRISDTSVVVVRIGEDFCSENLIGSICGDYAIFFECGVRNIIFSSPLCSIPLVISRERPTSKWVLQAAKHKPRLLPPLILLSVTPCCLLGTFSHLVSQMSLPFDRDLSFPHSVSDLQRVPMKYWLHWSVLITQVQMPLMLLD